MMLRTPAGLCLAQADNTAAASTIRTKVLKLTFLMTEVSHAREYHRKAKPVGGFNDFGVFH